jgi:hypothetical protein
MAHNVSSKDASRQNFMSVIPILDLIQQSTERLVAENLRSSSVVIARMHELIAEATRLGHPHKAIHARIEAGGLRTSWNNYRVYLARARRGSMKRPTKQGAASDSPHLPSIIDASQVRTEPMVARDATPASATSALDALADAKQTAAKNYSQIARSLNRRKSK